jgi:phage head maturation protease
MRFYAPLAKVDAAQRMVWGYASTAAEDDQGETITREALAAALDDYMRFANIREMHQLSAVGVAEEAAVDDKGLYVGARIIDPRAWEKVTGGVYKGYSIGGRVTQRDTADRSIITGLKLTEISLVDRPANPEAVFDCWKAEGGQHMAEAAAGANPPVQIWHCGVAAHRHLVKAEAIRCVEKRGGGDDGGAADDVGGEFADPGYQPDGEKRYPLDTEAHVRAAWAYIHQPGNAGRYSEAQLAHVKARIVAAWQEKVDPAGPPGDGVGGGKAMGAGMRKTGGELMRIGQIIGDLEWLFGFLHGMAGDGGGVISGDDAGEKAGRPGEMMKALAGEIVPRLDALAKRVEDIAATPLPPQTAGRGYMGISKRGDGGGYGDDVVTALSRMSDEERTLALIKAAHANPIRPVMR